MMTGGGPPGLFADKIIEETPALEWQISKRGARIREGAGEAIAAHKLSGQLDRKRSRSK